MSSEGAGERAQVPVEALVLADSPRLSGEDPAHARMLAERADGLPPILVQRGTLRVIDGMHRLRAALLRGDRLIEVRYFDGDDDAAFVRAVEANVTHGLPLSFADREAAAARILKSYPHRSDRAIATSVGLAAGTVASIRRRIGADFPQLRARVGQDGRVRPVNAAEGRQRAAAVIAEQPTASLRDVAAAAGVSPATVRDVRDRMRRGQDPVPSRQRTNQADHQESGCAAPQRSTGGVAGGVHAGEDWSSALETLKRDPSIRFTESGRSLIRWLESRVAGLQDWNSLVAQVPPHCAGLVANFARTYANTWLAIAAELDQRVDAAS